MKHDSSFQGLCSETDSALCRGRHHVTTEDTSWQTTSEVWLHVRAPHRLTAADLIDAVRCGQRFPQRTKGTEETKEKLKKRPANSHNSTKIPFSDAFRVWIIFLAFSFYLAQWKIDLPSILLICIPAILFFTWLIIKSIRHWMLTFINFGPWLHFYGLTHGCWTCDPTMSFWLTDDQHHLAWLHHPFTEYSTSFPLFAFSSFGVWKK